MMRRVASMDNPDGLAASADTRRVRDREQLDRPRLAAYLRDRLPGCDSGGLDLSREMEVEQFPGGHSNLTYLVRFGEGELVLRRPPSGPVPPTAHDMAREYRWLKAMHPVFPLAPRPYLFCDDAGVIGAVFYVMERRRGLVIRNEEPAPVADRPDVRRRVSAALIDALADLHAIDITQQGLSALGKPAGFVERQVRGWTERWHRSQIALVPEMDAVARWLAVHLPPEPARASVVHGDFKLDNVMLDRSDPGRLVAVFDWEMSALGDPLVDLGILLAYWSRRDPPGPGDSLMAVTHHRGWFTRDEIVEHYARRSDRDVSPIHFHETFALFKIAVVIQQIFSRYARGQTEDPRFARFDLRVADLARQAAALAESR
jgi:aminoglycoside phosphotransferase (APT) family kinase protein